jgi:hypothetical protein
MKKVFTYLLAGLMSVLVLYCGSGVNVVFFCCDNCRTEGMMAVAKGGCCDAHKSENADNHNHNHNNSEKLPHADCLNHSEKDCCRFERIDFEWNTSKIAESTYHLLAQMESLPIYLDFPVIPDIDGIKDDIPIHKTPPIKIPRQYLSELTILLI